MIFRVNGIDIDYDGDVPFTFLNILFYEEISHTLQLTADFTETNCKAFGYINRTDLAENKTKEIPAEFIHRLIYIPGTFVVKYQNGKFPFYFKAAGDFYNKTTERSVRDIDYGSRSFASAAEVSSYIAECVSSASAPVTFPMLINRKIYEKFPVKFNTDHIVNKYAESPVLSAINPTIPFPYLHFIYRSILEKLGYHISSNVFETTSFLKKLCIPSNFMLNEFEINSQVLEEKPYFITELSSGKDPEVTTLRAHNLTNYQFVKVRGNDSPYYLKDKIFQAEVTAPDKFKLIGADTSDYEEYSRVAITAKTLTKTGNLAFSITIAESMDQFVTKFFYMHSDDYHGLVMLGWDAETTLSGVIIDDPDYANHTFTHAAFSEKNYAAVQEEGTLIYLPTTMNNHIYELIISKQLPDYTIKDFFRAIQEYLGIVPFVSDTAKTVDIKLIDDILSDPNFIDITAFSEKILTIDNPGLDGYTLHSKADSSDINLKTMLPFNLIDSKKYMIQSSVLNRINLPQTDKTNDVRLVRNENTYYVFSRGFLNAENSWKFLCYNLLDKVSGSGDYKVDADISTLLKDNVSSYHAYNNNCMSKTFVDVEANIGLRLINYHGLLSRGENYLPYAAHDIYDESGNVIAGAQFALRWDTDNGILNRLRKREINWQVDRRKDFKTKTLWPAKYLADFKYYKKYRIEGVDCFVKSIKCTFKKDDSIEFNETELARV